MQANYAQSNYNEPRVSGVGARSDDDISPAKATAAPTVAAAPAKHDVDDEAASDYNQWLHAMKLVARLPGGMPPEFRRKVSYGRLRLWVNPLGRKYLCNCFLIEILFGFFLYAVPLTFCLPSCGYHWQINI